MWRVVLVFGVESRNFTNLPHGKILRSDFFRFRGCVARRLADFLLELFHVCIQIDKKVVDFFEIVRKGFPESLATVESSFVFLSFSGKKWCSQYRNWRTVFLIPRKRRIAGFLFTHIFHVSLYISDLPQARTGNAEQLRTMEQWRHWDNPSYRALRGSGVRGMN